MSVTACSPLSTNVSRRSADTVPINSANGNIRTSVTSRSTAVFFSGVAISVETGCPLAGARPRSPRKSPPIQST